MDLHLIPGAEATPPERNAVDAVLGAAPSGWFGGPRRPDVDGHIADGGDAIRERRHMLLPALWALQSGAGWISPGGMNYVCQRLDVAPADAYGVATFYAMLSVSPQPAAVAHVCDDIACRLAGAREICAELQRRLGAPGGQWRPSPCLGQCERGPAVLFQRSGSAARDTVVAPCDAEAVIAGLQTPAPGAAGTAPAAVHDGSTSAHQTRDSRRDSLLLLSRVGRVDPTSLDAYRTHGGYAALKRAFELGPEGVLRETLESKLMGRGGAAFPAGRKWDAVAKQPARPHYIVCNADESEPGTFKDRLLMEEDPFALIESMTIAAWATGCERGFVYIRGEYPLAIERVDGAIVAARAAGLLGERVLDEPFAFDIEVRRGAGAYICGEETALFNSIEGFRGEPRNKPPFPVQSGLFHKPTVINNVETLCNVPLIVLRGGAAYAAIGTAQSSGPKLFCLSGRVARPGVYEVPFGVTLRQLLDEAGGMSRGRALRAVLLGGAAGSFVGPDALDVPLTFEGTRAIGAALGSGVVMVFDDGDDLEDTVRRIAAFFRDESCGQCVPCRVGTERQEELVTRIASGRPLGTMATEIALLDEMARAMRDASICGLGQTASGAIQTAISKLGVFGNAKERS
ncbi:MAG TPA: NAD(P)H-dependent oxidoreductase subunit E [Thermoanaerobaculia bacterium]|nr:NAD(P)H-dependent oxidoreductase subunit E [Thermoanaerobaculia bacterium]